MRCQGRELRIFKLFGGEGISGKVAVAWELEEGVFDGEVAEFLVVLEIFSVEDTAVGFQSGGDDQGVIPGEGVLSSQIEGLTVEGIRRVDSAERLEGNCEKLFGFGGGHGRLNPAKSNAKEFLDDLKTDHCLMCLDAGADKAARPLRLFRSLKIEKIEEDVCVNEESIVHSFHRGCRDRPSPDV